MAVGAGVVCVTLVGALLVTGSSPDSSESERGGSSTTTVSLPFEPDPGTVYAFGRAFAPADVVANAGETVWFENAGDVAHTFTDDDGLFGSDPVEHGERYGFAYSRPGTYSFHCELHPEMRGEVTVTAPAT